MNKHEKRKLLAAILYTFASITHFLCSFVYAVPSKYFFYVSSTCFAVTAIISFWTLAQSYRYRKQRGF